MTVSTERACSAVSAGGRRLASCVAALCLLSMVSGDAWGQGFPKAPELPAVPEAPKVEAPKAPKAPEIPEMPGGGDKAKAAPKGPTRKVLDHKKQFLFYPRVGYLRVFGASTDGSDVGHATVGAHGQFAISRTFFVSAESHLLYISSGSYGLTYDGTTISRYSEGNFTSLTGVGFGMFTGFLDKQELWTQVGLKVGYLHPFFLPIWVTGDIQKEFRRTRTSYWTISAAPALGLLVPLRSAVGRDTYLPSAAEEEGEAEPSSIGIKFFAGAQLSIAFIFAPRG